MEKTFPLFGFQQVCTYRNCNHSLADHDGKKCKCKHYQTEVSGLGFQPKAVIFFNS